MILRLSLFILIVNIKMLAINVLVSNEAIKFEEKLDASKIKTQNITNLNKNCEPLSSSSLQNEEYITTHYINKNTVICTKDVKKSQENTVVFNFGGVRIEKKGKIIFENDDFIKIKNIDGTIEQIYKDGRIK